MSSAHSDPSVDLPTIDEGAWTYQPSPRDAGQSWGTWLWLMDDSALNDLLVLGPASSVRGIAGRFAAVREHQVPGSTPRTPIPHPDSSFDCVVARGAIESSDDDPALWQEASRVLRPDGTLYIDGPNPMWHRALLTFKGNPLARFRRVSGIARSLQASGFRSVRAYYVEPDLTAPRTIIPAVSHAVVAWQRLRLQRGVRRFGRIAAAVAGRHDLLFRNLFLVARK